jgi:tripartite-type tricarboxylate transporter receptor subunit TctC
MEWAMKQCALTRASVTSTRALRLAIAAVVWAVALSALDASAQSYPVKPIRIVSGFAAGGGVDIMARLLSPKMTEALGQLMVIESRPGAGSNIAMEYVVKSPPDGYTLLMNSPPVAINMSLYGNLPFDTVRDLTAVSVFSATPNVLAVHPSVPARSAKDLIALARSKPGTLNFSSGGNGTTQHLSGELLKLRTRTSMVHVPYKGSSPSMTALIGGEVEFTIANIPSVIEYIKAKRLRPLATTTPQRTVLMPDVPTMRESGLDMIVMVWYSVHAPAATPRSIVNRLSDAIRRGAHAPDTKRRLFEMGAEPVGLTPDDAQKMLQDEVALWGAVVRASGAQPN